MSLFRRSGVPLSAFIRGIVKALCDAQQAIPHARQEQLECHFEQQEDGSYKPKTVDIDIGQDQLLTVPTYSLSQVNTIGLKSARITCAARVADLAECDKCGTMTCGDTQVRFKVDPAHDGERKTFMIELDFEQRETTEAEARIIEALSGD